MTKLIQSNRRSLGANHKKDKIDSVESTKFRSKSQKKDKIVPIESTTFRSKSQTHTIDSVESIKIRSKSQKIMVQIDSIESMKCL